MILFYSTPKSIFIFKFLLSSL